MFKKITLITLMVTLLSCFAFAKSGNRTEIDKFLDTYEELVIQAEKLAASNSLSDLMMLDVKVIELAEQADKIQEDDDFTMADLKRYTDLSFRYSNAMLTVTNSMSATTTDTLNALNAAEDETQDLLDAMDALQSMGALDMSAYGF